MGTTPFQSAESVVEIAIAADAPLPGAHHGDHAVLLEQLWQASKAEPWQMKRGDFCAMLLQLGHAQNYGLAGDAVASAEQQADFFRSLRIEELALARACAEGSESAWQHFLSLYHSPLTRAAIAICGNETQGRDMADALYAELFGLTTRDGERRSPLASYKGRGSLIGWLRTTLAQRHVDHHRRTHRETPLDESKHDASMPVASEAMQEHERLIAALQEAFAGLNTEDRFLLTAYYLDRRTLHQLVQLLHVHEATISRRLHRLVDEMRKQVLRNLQHAGLSKRAAQEALGTDPRDLDLNLRKLLQSSQTSTFQEQAG